MSFGQPFTTSYGPVRSWLPIAPGTAAKPAPALEPWADAPRRFSVHMPKPAPPANITINRTIFRMALSLCRKLCHGGHGGHRRDTDFEMRCRDLLYVSVTAVV